MLAGPEQVASSGFFCQQAQNVRSSFSDEGLGDRFFQSLRDRSRYISRPIKKLLTEKVASNFGHGRSEIYFCDDSRVPE
jgi:hypothetical protein